MKLSDALIKASLKRANQPFQVNKAKGMLVPGNIGDLYRRPVLNNPDGSYSTTSSASFKMDGKEILIPTVVNGKRLVDTKYDPDDIRHWKPALDHYDATGEHLGHFDTPENADAYAQLLHKSQENQRDGVGLRLPKMKQ